MKDYDVAIIGGGLLGSAFGWGLTQRNLRTVVFDEGDNAIRTARGNFGLVWVQGKGVGMPEYARWSLNSSLQWRGFSDQLQQETGVDCHYERRGGFVVCLDDNDFEANQKLLETLRQESTSQAYEFDIVDHAELKKHMPLIGDVPGGSYCPNDGHCNPLSLLRALHTGFLNSGGDYRPHNHISQIRGLEGGGFELSTSDNKMVGTANKLIISAGHGSAELGAQIGLDLPVFPDQGQVLVTEKVERILDYPTNYVRQTDEGCFLLGPSSRDVGYSLATDPPTLSEITRRCLKAFPLLSSLRIQRSWAALRVMTPDGCPVYQQSEEFPGAFSFSCHSGVTLAAVHALEVSQWVEEGAIPEQYQAFHPGRFDV
ncbi:MAG: glycine/D-amino acid oxidase-like deaminating enzyme [Gammaproteobacteria bacterium]|jgi:glycine/D-amino acid oxidase-like deaminating enzyme